MNDIKLIFNCVNKSKFNGEYMNNRNITLYDFNVLDAKNMHMFISAKICRDSLVFIEKSDDSIYQFEIVESDPPMKPEELLKIWRLLYE